MLHEDVSVGIVCFGGSVVSELVQLPMFSPHILM